MATSEKLLSVKGGEKPNEIDANTEDSSMEHVGGPENTWSTANYANFKFDAAVGVSPDSSIPVEVDAEKADKLEEAEVCPSCGKEPCECDSLKEVEGEAPAEKKADESGELAAVDEAEDEKAEDEKAEMPAAEAVDAAEDTDEDDEDDSEDDTLDLDLADLIDDDEDVVELPAADEKDMSEDDMMPAKDDDKEDDDFNPAEEDKVWEEDEPQPVKVDVEDGDDMKESDDADQDDEKKDDAPMMEDEDADDEKKDELKEEGEDEEEKKDELKEEDDDEEEKKDEKPVMEGKLRLSFKTDEVTKLFENNTVLTEEDKRQSRALFESAIKSVAQQLGKQLQEAYQVRFDAAKQQHEAKVAKQLDAYLSYVVEQWAKDNKVALQNQLRNRLTESFLNGFKKLCTEHYIDVPESKVNVVEALAKNVKSLKTKLKNAEAQNVKLHEEAKNAVKRERLALKQEHKARLIAEASSAVTAADRGEFVQRAQTLKFVATKEFKKDLIALREQYFGAKKSVERPADEPVAAPIFESKQPQSKSAVDVYTKIADRLTRQS